MASLRCYFKTNLLKHFAQIFPGITCISSTRALHLQKPEECPNNNNVLTKNVVYKAEITLVKDKSVKEHIRMTATIFKERFRDTRIRLNCLSTCGILIKGKDKKFNIKWPILKRVPSYTACQSRCNLCIEEKCSPQNLIQRNN